MDNYLIFTTKRGWKKEFFEAKQVFIEWVLGLTFAAELPVNALQFLDVGLCFEVTSHLLVLST